MINPPTDQQVYRMPLRVSSEHIDDLHHVNNVVYVSWIQEVAYAHWKAAAPESLRSQCRWVVMRHQVDYFVSAVEGDKLELITWVDAAQGARSVRHVSIQRTSDHKVLAYAETTWCLLDPVSGKPKRVAEEIDAVLRSECGE
jgi:acyl-CoA thioester hydrolase